MYHEAVWEPSLWNAKRVLEFCKPRVKKYAWVLGVVGRTWIVEAVGRMRRAKWRKVTSFIGAEA